MSNPLAKIKHNLRTQDNRITSHPIFVVEQKKILSTHADYEVDGHLWIDYNSEKADERETRILDKLSERNYEDVFEAKDSDRGWYKWYYQEIWEFVTACFTEQGCNDYLKLNRHNLNETRIYVYSGYRNEEMINLRSYLMGDKEKETHDELRTIRLLAKKFNRLGVEQKERVGRLEFERKMLMYQYGSAMKMLHAYAEKYTDWKPSHGWDLPPNA
jgi:hypothetical protein